MELACGKVKLSDYSLLRLITSEVVLRREMYIMDEKELEYKLSEFKNRNEYKNIFEGVEKIIDETDNEHFDLHEAFTWAYKYGLLKRLSESPISTKFLINIVDEDAINIQKSYNPDYISKVKNLCKEIYKK